MESNPGNVVKARSTIVWLLALAVAFGAVWWIEKQSGRTLIAPSAAATAHGTAAVPDRAALERAWAYFHARDPGTVTDAAEAAATLTALMAARDLHLVSAADFAQRLQRAQAAVAALPRAATSASAPGAAGSPASAAEARRHAATLERAALATSNASGSAS